VFVGCCLRAAGAERREEPGNIEEVELAVAIEVGGGVAGRECTEEGADIKEVKLAVAREVGRAWCIDADDPALTKQCHGIDTPTGDNRPVIRDRSCDLDIESNDVTCPPITYSS